MGLGGDKWAIIWLNDWITTETVMKTIFDGFDLDGISYYFSNGKYYADDMTIRRVISSKEYRDALMCKLIEGE